MTTPTLTRQPTPMRRYIDIVSASYYSGVSISTIRRWIQRGIVTGHRPAGGRRIVLDTRELDRVIRSGQGDAEEKGTSDKEAV